MKKCISILFFAIIGYANAQPAPDFDYNPEFEKTEVFIILKEFETMDALKAYYRDYRAQWIKQNPTKAPPEKNVLAFSKWGAWDGEGGDDMDYCVVFTVKPTAESLHERSCQIGHEAWHCFKGNYH